MTTRPPLATLEWALRTDGKLTQRERVQLLGPILRTSVQYAVGRLRLVLDILPARQASLALEALRFPDTSLAREVEEVCKAKLSTTMLNHSYRTFVYGLALAVLDNVTFDEETFYVASLLHDVCLESPQPGRCFAVRGAEVSKAILEQSGADIGVVNRIAEAVALHITPGIRYNQNATAALIAGGALLDLAGFRLWDMQRTFVQQVIERYPRGDVRRHLARCWRMESKQLPQGRAALVEKTTFFSTLIRLAPFDDRA
jgi:hypothetical protein